MNLRDILQARQAAPPLLDEVLTPELAPDCQKWFVRRMPGLDYLACDRLSYDDEGRYDIKKAALALVLYATCDESGQRVFQDDDRDLVAGLAGSLIERTFEAALALNLMRVSDRQRFRKNCKTEEASASSIT